MKKQIPSSVLFAACVALLPLQAAHAASPDSQVRLGSEPPPPEVERIQSPSVPVVVPPPSTTQQPAHQPKIRPQAQAPATYTSLKSERGQLTVLNCSGTAQTIRVYNRNDSARIVPFMVAKVGHNTISQALTCKVQPCTLIARDGKNSFSGGTSVGRMGPQVFLPQYFKDTTGGFKGTNYETMKRAMTYGCSVYQP